MKYRVESDFKHPIYIQGKKVLLYPNDVIESPIELVYIFLMKVPDDTPVTKRNGQAAGGLVAVQKQVETLKTLTTDEANKSNAALQEQFDSLHNNFSEAIAALDTKTKEINEFIIAKNKDIEIFKATANRRLDILREAVQSMEDAVYGSDEQSPKA